MFISTGINDTPTIVGKAGIPLVNAALHAAKFNAQGEIVPAAAGDNAVGLFIASTPDNVAAGEDVTIQIKDVGLWVTGAAVLAGAEVAVNAAGQAITAAANAFIVGIALETATAAGQVIKVQIVKAGYKNGGAVAPLTLAGLTDVAIANVADGDVIAYDLATQKYINKALGLADLADVSLANIADGDAIVYDLATTSYINKALGLADLADVSLANIADGDAIVYDLATTSYINKALGLADLADVSLANIADGDAIVYDLATTSYINKALSLDDLADVDIANPADAETLTYVLADTKWKNL
jgi:endonuclease YncB( thermonuclease family)